MHFCASHDSAEYSWIDYLNPAVTFVIQVDQCQLGELNRSKGEAYVAGGKGINASLVLQRECQLRDWIRRCTHAQKTTIQDKSQTNFLLWMVLLAGFTTVVPKKRYESMLQAPK